MVGGVEDMATMCFGMGQPADDQHWLQPIPTGRGMRSWVGDGLGVEDLGIGV